MQRALGTLLTQYFFVFRLVQTHLLSRVDSEPYEHPRWVLCLRVDFQGPLADHEQGLKVFERLDGSDKKVGQYRAEGLSELCI